MFNIPNAFKGPIPIYFGLTLGFSLAISAWLHLCKEFTIFYFIMMLILVAIQAGFISVLKLHLREGTSLLFLTMVKQGSCITKESAFVCTIKS